MNIVITMLVTGAMAIMGTSLFWLDKQNDELREGKMVTMAPAQPTGDQIADSGY